MIEETTTMNGKATTVKLVKWKNEGETNEETLTETKMKVQKVVKFEGCRPYRTEADVGPDGVTEKV